MVWLLGRMYCTGTPADYAAVHALQDKFSLVPLSSYGKPYTPLPGTVGPSVDMKAGIRDQVDAMDITAYFNYLAQLMKTNPTSADDAPLVAIGAKEVVRLATGLPATMAALVLGMLAPL
jgi:hypothetical protein